MKKSLFVYLGMLLSYVSFGQYLTNLNYAINFGDLAEIDVPYKASKSVLDGDYLYHITYSSTTTLGNHILVKKHHVDGTPAWEAVYGDIGPITNNHAVDIKVDASGNVYIVGATKHLTEGYNALVVKYNNIGMKQWEYTYHSSGSDDDIATALDIDGSGNCYITGSTLKTTDKDVFVLKVDNMGNNGFATTYNYDNFDDGGIFIDYVSSSSIEVAAITQDDAGGYQLSKLIYNSTGILQNSYRTNIGYGNMRINDLKAVGGEYMVCGAVENSNGDWDFAVYSLSSNMTTNWSYIHDENGYDDEANALVVDGSGNVYATGYVNQNNNEPQLATVKLNSSGTQQWLAAYDYPVHFDSWGKAIDLSGSDLLITGEIVQSNNQTDIITIFTSVTDGELKWRKEYDHRNNDNAINAFIIDDLEFVITGNSEEDENFVIGYELLKENKEVIIDEEYGSYLKNQIIVAFHPEILKTTLIDNKDKSFGILEDFLQTSDITTMQNALAGLADLSTTKVSKVFTRLTTVDSTVITHDGDTIELPPFWATLCLHFQDSINADTIIYTSDSLLKSLFDYQERNRVMADINFSPNDFYFNNGNQEHLENKTSSNIGINMEKAWNIERGRTSIRTGVYDTGVAWDHEDFELSTQGGLNSYKINGGFDYIDNLTIDKSTTDHSVAPGSNPSSPNLAIGHGTICAGIIGARTNNFKNSQYLGVAGIAGGNNTQSYGTTLYSYRVIGQSLIGVAGASSTQIADAILDSYVDGGSKLHLTNNSWGASYFNDKDYIDNGYETLRRQFWKGTEAGVLFVMASGNDNDDRPTYPSCLFDPGMIRVGAYSNNLERASFSNYGPFLDLVAPGTEEQYTVLTQSGGYYNSTSDDYLINGTSFAAPHVTGVAALMISEWEESGEDSNNEGAETLYPEDIEWILKQSANDIDYDNQVTEEEADEGYDEFTGWGQLDAYKALQMVERPNFTIVHLAKTISFNINNATPVLDDKKICMEGNFDNLINGKNHKVTVYEVSTTIKQELPAGYKIVNQNTPQLGSISISENGYWPLNNKSGLFGYDAANEKFWGHSGLEFVSAPQVITENGTKYIEGTIKGYFCYVRKRSGSITDNIEQWYPFNPNNKDVTLAFSVYLIDETLSVPALGENNSGLVIFPNPAEDFVTIRSYYNDLPNMILYSIDGKVQDINFEKVSGSDFKIDLSGLSTGVYILKSQSEGHCSFNRIIKN